MLICYAGGINGGHPNYGKPCVPSVGLRDGQACSSCIYCGRWLESVRIAPKGRLVKPPFIPRTCSCGGVQVADYHRHPDGSHWCNRCLGYCGSSGDYGCDMADAHPTDCACPPCPHGSTGPHA